MTSGLKVEFLACGRRARLKQDYTFFDAHGVLHTLPAGFETDFASWIRPIGAWTFAAVVHDYLYYTGEVSRHEADRIFLEIMKADGVNAARRQAYYRAVRLFGRRAWYRHRAREQQETEQ